MSLVKTTEMSIVIIVSVLLIGNLVFSSNNYKAVGITNNRTIRTRQMIIANE
jgi:hypothetical protein